MSSRARRIGAPGPARTLHVGRGAGRRRARTALRRHRHGLDGRLRAARGGRRSRRPLERDAFTKGYAQGERAGSEAGASRADAMLRRLAQTLDDLQGLRSDLIRRTEREVVELSLAIARKVLQREVSLDHDLLLAMARVALDRLADVATASIRLHPDDYAVVALGRGPSAVTTHGVQIVADGSVRRGGCVVQSEFGSVDIGVGDADRRTDARPLRRRRAGAQPAGGTA